MTMPYLLPRLASGVGGSPCCCACWRSCSGAMPATSSMLRGAGRPEPPTPDAARGTMVHAVLERLFDEPAAGRTPETARAMLAPQWERLIADEPELAGLFSDEEERTAWLAEASDMLDRYFTLEDPTRLEPKHREHAVEATLASRLLLRGYIDRLDVRADGEIRIVDHKTGTAPREEFEARALLQMKFYAVVLWLTQQRVPKLLH